jgi:hypothetical protein
MRCTPSPSYLGAGARLAAAFCLAAMLAGVAAARQGSGPPPRPDMGAMKRAEMAERERTARLRTGGLVSRADVDKRQSEASAKAVSQDFRDLQLLRNDIARHLVAGGPIDYGLVADKSGEIHKRANRLKTRLMPAGVEQAGAEQGAEARLEAERMTGALVSLCKLIDRFSKNPVFDMQGVVDVKESTQAGADLESIIELSEAIRKGAQSLEKTARR